MIKEASIQTFLDELAGKSSTPGGGSAAAVIGAMGAALLSMVANFTIGRKDCEAAGPRMRALLSESERLRADLTALIQEDVEAFNRVMAAYAMPKAAGAEKEARTAAIQSALKLAADVPLRCARLCAELIRLSRDAAESGNANVISDAGVAVLAAEAGLRSAALNVTINLNAIRDRAFADDCRRRLEAILAGSESATEEVYRAVLARL